MIKLTGRIRSPRLAGSINMVPAEGGGGPLQAKTAYPSHSEQIIAPDEDYYGLVAVTVKPVPRLPACEVSVYGEVFIQTHALYGGVRLPLLPEDVLAQYPYCWIWKDTDTGEYKAFFSTAIWYYNRSTSKGRMMYRTVSETSPVYVYSAENDAWEFLQNHRDNQKIGTYSSGSIIWTNFDVPSGSADATSYFEYASTPGLTV